MPGTESLIRRAVEIVKERPELLKLPKEEGFQQILEQIREDLGADAKRP